ncbi:MAG: SufE family protein [Bdellovibrionaceae bacterium]|nr:SufE family protein [Pseudobdellovibrionaceae bacterium]MDW8190105.1 SufE family protein [Pseudobdellovibrionaceae bacterium]
MNSQSPSKSIKSRETEWNQFFNQFHSWQEKYKALIELRKKLPPYPEDKRLDDLKVKGCQSQVWLWATQMEPSKEIQFWADSDALITKGLVAFLVLFYSGLPAEEIAQHDVQYFKNLGLAEHLSPSRANGFYHMINQIKRYAFAFYYHDQQQNQNRR